MKTKLAPCFLFCLFVSISFSVSAQYPTQGLVANYRLNGNAGDSSGNDLHGIDSGSIAGMTDRNGVPNGALYFDGIDDYIRVASDSLLEPDTFLTICVWVKPEVTPNYPYNTILTKRMYHATDPYNSYILDAGGTATQNKYFFSLSTGTTQGSQHELDGTYDWTTSTGWDFVVASYDGTTMRLYINGVLNASFAHPGGIGYTAYDLFIGTSSYPFQFLYKGGMDDIAIYDRVLSPQEITTLYGSPSAVQTPVENTPATSLYPNPAGNQLKVNLNGGELPAGMQIIDSKGALVMNGSFSETINLENLGEGLYFLRLQYSDGRAGESLRFVRISN